jgi:hypothetical protein
MVEEQHAWAQVFGLAGAFRTPRGLRQLQRFRAVLDV